MPAKSRKKRPTTNVLAALLVQKKVRGPYGDPRRPESVIVARQLERKKIAAWMERWANVRMRGHDYSAIEKKSAQTILTFARYLAIKQGPELGDLTDIGRRERAALKNNAKTKAKRAAAALAASPPA